MTTPSEKLAASLAALKSLQDQRIVAIRAKYLTRTHRERLLKTGFIIEVMKGWYMPARPNEPAGESTTWYTGFWKFCLEYLNERFGAQWCLSPEHSLSLHTGNWTVPKQLLVRSPKAGNKPTQLLFGTSVFDVRLELPAPSDIEVLEGLRIMKLSHALLNCAPTFFATNPIEVRIALSIISDSSDLSRQLLSGGHSVVAGRIAGALRNIGRVKAATDILETMRSAGYAVSETDPFADKPSIIFATRQTSPDVNRLRMLWENMRRPILASFPRAPGLAKYAAVYLKQVDDKYVIDAYNSLSIEGYQVSEELIGRVRSGNWNPDSMSSDRNHLDALAARGYWQAFQKVKVSIGKVLRKQNPGSVAENDHSAWYRELFSPSVAAGLMKATDLAGYRNGPVYIRRSMHVPPRYEAVRELMPTLFELLANESEPAVRMVLGHFMFVYIHPYVDGNGRMGRFLMNVMAASGGYPWTIIPLAKRGIYMTALETASVDQNIKPFSLFVADLVKKK